MPGQDGLTSGISSTTNWTDINGNQKFEILESFTFKENSDVKDETAIDGKTRHPLFLFGWTGSAVFQRGSNFIDTYFANRERNYYLGGDQINLTVTQTIKEVNGSISQYQFTGLILQMDDGGMYSGTEIVKQTLSWKCSRRLKL
jgi:hypothetical protein